MLQGSEEVEVVIVNNLPLEVKWKIGYWLNSVILSLIFILVPPLGVLEKVRKDVFFQINLKWKILMLLCVLWGILWFITVPYRMMVTSKGIIVDYLLFRIFIPNDRIEKVELEEDFSDYNDYEYCVAIYIHLRKRFFTFSKYYVVFSVSWFDHVFLGNLLGIEKCVDNGEIYVLEAMEKYYMELKNGRIEREQKLGEGNV